MNKCAGFCQILKATCTTIPQFPIDFSLYNIHFKEGSRNRAVTWFSARIPFRPRKHPPWNLY
ncbi:hypothetical protein SLEP1_g14527 [Rubroshorea leprosula]|uniref:Uncharacterized protein n=1 Tax=Rubroshorea leprosula TaxID=152421 RepID=A0AAV5ITU5_9ROSI|nr:hypothetical protein SLEP1_g14527 [Rubroshorea leprosula]